MGFFEVLPMYPLDPIFGLSAQFEKDPRDKKIDLTVGIYHDEDIFPVKMRSTVEAEEMIIKEDKRAEYLSSFGLHEYIEKAGELTLGEDFWREERARIAASQGLGGTGTLRVLADFLRKDITASVCISNPTWPNHLLIFERANFSVKTYPYYNKELHRPHFKEIHHTLSDLPPQTVVLFHASCHNPTGYDLSQDEWKALSILFFEKKLIPLFDLAYQGLGRGLDEDAWPIRFFAEQGHEMLVSVTHSKTFSLYNQRIGLSLAICREKEVAERARNAMRVAIRSNYSNPPHHGAAIIAKILMERTLRKKWEGELAVVRNRIQKMQTAFADKLCAKCTSKDFTFLKNRTGLFAYTELTKEQIDRMIKDDAIYIPSNGRINVTRMNDKNIDDVVNAIAKVL